MDHLWMLAGEGAVGLLGFAVLWGRYGSRLTAAEKHIEESAKQDLSSRVRVLEALSVGLAHVPEAMAGMQATLTTLTSELARFRDVVDELRDVVAGMRTRR